VGIVSWVISGIAAFLVARIIPLLRQTQWIAELVTAIVSALLAGLAATALDFGGWRELDWRAAAFAFCVALAAAGVVRAVRGRMG
jgi:uncharacterized membrane protein SirB2